MPKDKVQCPECGKDFAHRSSLYRHKRIRHLKKVHRGTETIPRDSTSTSPGRSFSTPSRHSDEDINPGGSPSTSNHSTEFAVDNNNRRKPLTDDAAPSSSSKTQPSSNSAKPPINHQDTSSSDDYGESSSALDNAVKIHNLNFNEMEKNDMLVLFRKIKKEIFDLLTKEVKIRKGLKWYLVLRVKLTKDTPSGEKIESSTYFRSVAVAVFQETDVEAQIILAFQKILKSFDEFQRQSSGWVFEHVLKCQVITVDHLPIGSSYIELPKELVAKRAIINIQNHDDLCFLYCIAANLFPVKINANRPSQYTNKLHHFNTTGITFPMKVNQIPKFEKMNNLRVNVFGFDCGSIFPLYVSENIADTHVNLLYLSEEGKAHYCLIQSMSRLFGKSGRRAHFFCCYCMSSFTKKSKLDSHVLDCKQNSPQRVVLPSKGENTLEYNDFGKELPADTVLYADFECILKPLESVEDKNTQKLQEHIPSGYGYVVVSDYEELNTPAKIYRGEGVVQHFLESLFEEVKKIKACRKKFNPIIMSEEDEANFESARDCHICKKPIENIKCRDHNHESKNPHSNFRGASHQSCNLKLKQSNKIQVFIHSSRSYDTHIIIKALEKFPWARINCIANNMEKYISFSVHDIQFIDSLQFLGASLDTLVGNFAVEGVSKFKLLLRHFSKDHTQLLMRKGVFPYEYIDSFDKFLETSLPPREAFFSSLTQETVSEEDYNYAQKVWSGLNIQTLGDFHDLYLLVDVLTLGDCMENFRKISYSAYGLDPARFVTLPSFSWSAALKMTSVKFDLITDIDMYLMLENSIRAGLTQVTLRESQANNSYMQDFDPAKPSVFHAFLDVNSLYAKVMTKSLPTGQCRWISSQEIHDLDIMSIPSDGPKGFFLEVDLIYPDNLHDSQNDFPLAPEKYSVKFDELSPYTQNLHEKLGLMKSGSVPKLMATLKDKTKYVVHYVTLQLYLQLGLKIKQIHRGIEFDQSPFLKPYIEKNIQLRTEAKTPFLKSVYKLFSNALYGKTLQNNRKHTNVYLITSKKQLSRRVNSPAFQEIRIFSEGLVGVRSKQVVVKLDRPIFVGFAILDLAKEFMYSLHYLHFKQWYGSNITLQYTDTDSFFYRIVTQDMYKDFETHNSIFDFSDMPEDHFLFDETRKKQLGYLKDELCGEICTEFVGLRPKMYSALCVTSAKKAAKGVSKTVLKKEIRHDDYKRTLKTSTCMSAIMYQIRSFNHDLFTVSQKKITLSAYCDKRYYLNNAVESLAFGHKLIREKKVKST